MRFLRQFLPGRARVNGSCVDVVSGEPLFSSLDRFKSGTGWPSFTRPLDPANVRGETEKHFFVARTKIRTVHANSHLGVVLRRRPASDGTALVHELGRDVLRARRSPRASRLRAVSAALRIEDASAAGSIEALNALNCVACGRNPRAASYIRREEFPPRADRRPCLRSRSRRCRCARRRRCASPLPKQPQPRVRHLALDRPPWPWRVVAERLGRVLR